jgi:hypothetical protein
MRKGIRIISKLLIPAPSPMWINSSRTAFFGPEILSGNGGKPFREKRKFHANGRLPPFVLNVLNGNRKGDRMVTNGELSLNEKLLLGPSDFSQGFKNRQINVDLDDMNELEIRVADPTKPFTLTLWIEGFNRWNYHGFILH